MKSFGSCIRFERYKPGRGTIYTMLVERLGIRESAVSLDGEWLTWEVYISIVKP